MNFIKKKGLGIGLCIVLAAIATLLCKIQAGSFSFEIIGAPVFGILMGMIITLICPKLAANETLKDGIKFFDTRLHGFANPDSILTGMETRSSSPVRILRDENLVSNIRGIYPCGEGAGYAGGIMSASVDGIKCAIAAIARKNF